MSGRAGIHTFSSAVEIQVVNLRSFFESLQLWFSMFPYPLHQGEPIVLATSPIGVEAIGCLL